MNRVQLYKPWLLSFSYGRALQTSVLRAWKGNKDNSELARKEYIRLARVKKKKNFQGNQIFIFYFLAKCSGFIGKI
jgi:fructose-bisphosphate aldolase class I